MSEKNIIFDSQFMDEMLHWWKNALDTDEKDSKIKKPPKKKLARLIERSFSNLSIVAKTCGVQRQTVKKWIRIDKTGVLEEAVESGKEFLVDFAELQALNQMSLGDVRIIQMILKTLGKDRGYVEQKRFDPNTVGDLDLTQSQSGRIDLKVKHVLINSREDLERVYRGDVKQIENKTVENVIETIDAEFIEG